MITVNIFNTVRIAQQCHRYGVKNYFCVSTDKAANPVNMMGASKRIMEMFLMRESVNQQISMARFANVAFSDGSLLHGFNQRLAKFQPISAPYDVKRYFVTAQESGELCLLSGLFGENRDIFFPKLSEKLHLITFSGIAKRYLESKGYECFECASEAEARDRSEELIASNYWPCFFFESDTTGEKDFEEFYTSAEEINMDRFQTVGVIKNEPVFHSKSLDIFTDAVQDLKNTGGWGKEDIVQLYNELIPDFGHLETGKYLDQRM
jgi:FlaA1/EpsC-like NDP-sugar epimerase